METFKYKMCVGAKNFEDLVGNGKLKKIKLNETRISWYIES